MGQMALYRIASLLVTSGILTTSGYSHKVDCAMFRGHSTYEGSLAELAFTHYGQTVEIIPLSSGLVKEQVGLRLHEVNQCNLIYVMWEMSPTPRIVVFSKVNPGMSSFEECGNQGYTTVGSIRMAPPAGPQSLRASVDLEGVVRVSVNGTTVLKTALPEPARLLRGTCGVRSDNASWSFTLRC